MVETSLIRKYNVPGPRYTSYPTVPFWEETPDQQAWETHVKQIYQHTNEEKGISLYIHLPYCERLCTYCACNTRITTKHRVEGPYIELLLKEWQLYLDLFDSPPKIRELHLGGGTPTFFSAENLAKLLVNIVESGSLTDDAALSFEAHPNSTSKAHLKTLYEIGFRRLSLGIQDFDPAVQEIVNRVQSFETVKKVVDEAREAGYTSINFDLIYGLPLQRVETVEDTIHQVNKLRPERIAFYSYAHVPWANPRQRKFTEADLPKGEAKRALYERGKVLLEQSGYAEVGMDHFVLKKDDMYNAFQTGKLHRNFMGYTTNHTELMVGLGVSSISDSWTSFVQNEKSIEAYRKALDSGRFPFYRGHELSGEDLMLRRHILNLMCHFKTALSDDDLMHIQIQRALHALDPMIQDDLVRVVENKVEVSDSGKAFVRNICMAFDAKLHRSSSTAQLFSQTV